jgi:hypothetical protein
VVEGKREGEEGHHKQGVHAQITFSCAYTQLNSPPASVIQRSLKAVSLAC